MHDDPLPFFFLVSAIFFGAGIVKGVLGMGLPTFAMGFLGLLMPVPQAANLLTLPSLVTNLWQALGGGRFHALLRRFWTFQLAIAAGVAIASLLPPVRDDVARLLLGACLLAYGVLGTAGGRLPRPATRVEELAGAVAGAATGVITALTGVFVLPAVPYLQSLQLARQEFARVLGLSFTTSTVALAALLAARGDIRLAASVHSAMALAPALAGMWLGQKIRDELSEAGFRKCFFLGMVALGGWLLVR